MTQPSFDAATYVDCAADLLDLPIDPAFRPGVVDNLERIAAIAQLVLAFPLPDELIAAPVFEPFSPLPAQAAHHHDN